MGREEEDRVIALVQANLVAKRAELGISNDPAKGPTFPNVFALVPVANVVPIAMARNARHAKHRHIPPRDPAWDRVQAELAERVRRGIAELVEDDEDDVPDGDEEAALVVVEEEDELVVASPRTPVLRLVEDED
jgi:hypothetical protein